MSNKPGLSLKSLGPETLLGSCMVGVLMVMLLPLPAFLLDLLLSLSVSLSLVVFLFALHIDRPLDFSAFPSVLLLTTLLRLALNVASTRRILLHGNEGVEAAGHVIQAFGQFVVGGNMVVGIIIFLILVVINFVVVTKGASRIAEVAARFTLDSMPGKQMAIDADLAAGLCTEVEARRRRRTVEQEADFFGAMDGAGKFVRGDAVAGLLITGVNIVGGLVVGVMQQHMPIGTALSTYTNLTVGDGLVTQLPALLTSIAAGLVTTRAAAGAPLTTALGQQLFGQQRTLGIASVVLTCLAMVPGMPHLAFLALAGGLAVLARYVAKPDGPLATATTPAAAAARTPEAERAEVEAALPIDLLEIEVGYELVPLVDSERDGALLQRIAGLRKQTAQDLGIIVPPVHLRDNLRLRPGEYRVLLSGNVIGRGELRPGRWLLINPSNMRLDIPGEDARDPAFDMPGRWIAPADKARAEMQGLTVVDAAAVAATHLGELLTSHAHELLGRREAQELLDVHGRQYGRVIEELLPTQMSLTQLLKVLRNLLRERVSIRDFRTILEALADNAADVKDPDMLTELVRQRLGKQITHRHKREDGTLGALVLSPSVEATFRRMQVASAGTLDSKELQAATRAFEQAAQNLHREREMPVVLTSADVRRSVATFAQRTLPGLSVLSFREVDPQATVKTVGVIGAGAPELRHAS